MANKIEKLKAFGEIKALGERWLKGDRRAVVSEILDLRKPKSILYPAAVHRYIVKEHGFSAGSDFVTAILNEISD